MLRINLLLTIFLLICSCKGDPSNRLNDDSSKVKSSNTNIKNEVSPEDGDVASKIAGEFEGYGELSTLDQKGDKEFKSIRITRIGDHKVTITSPDNVFPPFAVDQLVDQFTSIVGETEGKGSFSYSKGRKKINALINEFDDSSVLRFMMP